MIYSLILYTQTVIYNRILYVQTVIYNVLSYPTVQTVICKISYLI